MTDYQEVRTTEHEQGRGQRVATFKVTQVIWLLLALLEAVLALRFVFKLVGVYAVDNFATLLYNVTNLFVHPFASLTGTPSDGNVVLEPFTLIAMVVYLLIAWGLVKIIFVAFYQPRGPISTRQTVVAEHIPQRAPVGVSQTTTTDRTTTQAPLGSSQTTVTERTNTQTPGPL
jgi:hypothetical protein